MSASATLDLRDRLATARILVVGDVMVDRYWFGDVDRISPEAPVPIVHVRREEHRLGGAANVARNIRALGVGVRLLSVIGADVDGARLETMLERAGIDSGLQRRAGFTTTVKLRVSGRAQQMVRIDFEDRPDHELLAQLWEEFERCLPTHGGVVLSDYGKGGLAHVSRMIAAAHAQGVATLVDPKRSDFAAYRYASIITPNRAELTRVIGGWDDEHQLAERAQNLREAYNLGALLLTRSEDGMSLFDHAGTLHVPAAAREVFDVTGAGDTVIAVLGALVAAGVKLRDAVPIANRAAAVVVGKFGTSAASFEEVFA